MDPQGIGTRESKTLVPQEIGPRFTGYYQPKQHASRARDTYTSAREPPFTFKNKLTRKRQVTWERIAHAPTKFSF